MLGSESWCHDLEESPAVTFKSYAWDGIARRGLPFLLWAVLARWCATAYWAGGRIRGLATFV